MANSFPCYTISIYFLKFLHNYLILRVSLIEKKKETYFCIYTVRILS